ncbi:MAG: hypothetical protein JM58_03985 [Peptococcaceae bacterium BICA1-8]|nr:MAG: hypothetical protein JM58_03985 [Peptococcaceae bacterium BICA1-8]
MNKYKLLSIIVLIILFCITITTGFTASNQDKLDLDISQEDTELNQSIKIGSLLFRYIFSVLGVLILTYFGVKLFARGTSPQTEFGGWVQILDHMPLGTNRGIYLVEIENKGYVLGITEQQINVLTTIDDQVRLDELRGTSIKNDHSQKLRFNFFKPKKKNNFQQSLEHHIKHTQEIYFNNKKGDKNL